MHAKTGWYMQLHLRTGTDQLPKVFYLIDAQGYWNTV